MIHKSLFVIFLIDFSLSLDGDNCDNYNTVKSCCNMAILADCFEQVNKN